MGEHSGKHFLRYLYGLIKTGGYKLYNHKHYCFVRDGGDDFKGLFRGLFRGKGLPKSNKMRARGEQESLQFLVIFLDKLLREFKFIYTGISYNHDISIISILNYYFYFILFGFFSGSALGKKHSRLTKNFKSSETDREINSRF